MSRNSTVAFFIAAVMLSLAPMTSALADVVNDQTVRDARGDAHRALDITRVTVSHTDRAVRVVVKVSDYASMDSAARVPTALGVHFDTKGDRKPDYLIKMDGMHVAAGSTRDWNKLRPNGLDPWGDWMDCFPRDWNLPVIKARPARNEVVFNAPRRCLGDAASLRIAVQSYKPFQTRLTQDWVKGVRRYLPSVTF